MPVISVATAPDGGEGLAAIGFKLGARGFERGFSPRGIASTSSPAGLTDVDDATADEER